MTKVTLPRLNQTGTNEWADVESNDVAIREVVNGGIDNENFTGAAGITRANLAAESKPVTWYTPKVIATEETRENVAFGTLTTKDEITGVVVPENGLLCIDYMANWKNSVASAGRAAVFIGANQLKLDESTGLGTLVQEAKGGTSTATFTRLVTYGALGGLLGNPAGASSPDVTTGQTLALGTLKVFVAAGTYAISVQYKATSGSVAVKDRRLYVEVHGF